MTKKYRLNCSKYKGFIANYFVDYDGMILIPGKNKNEFAVYPGDKNAHISFVTIPKEFQCFLLEEIKDEPKPIDEIVKEMRAVCQKGNFTPRQYECWLVKAGEENNELRHRPKENFECWRIRTEFHYPPELAPYLIQVERLVKEERERAWLACEKNRGFNEEKKVTSNSHFHDNLGQPYIDPMHPERGTHEN